MARSLCNCKNATIVEDVFGQISAGKDTYRYPPLDLSSPYNNELVMSTKSFVVKSYTMKNTNRMEVVLISWGASIVSIKCPDKFGEPADIVLGFDNIENYTNPRINPFIGCILGRCANRIKDGTITIRDENYKLTLNDDRHHLHGGNHGFGRQLWNSQIDGSNVIMSYLSADGEEGYPGAVLITVKFKLTVDNKLEINIRASTSKPTIINISHASFFNLAGHDAGPEELKCHSVTLNCDRWTFADYNYPIPTGAIRGVGGSVMDLRIPRELGESMNKIPRGGGYDHNFCVTQSWQPGIAFIGRALHEKSGRVLEVYSDQPGVQFYTGGRLPMPITDDVSSSASSEHMDSKNFDELANYASYAGDQEHGEEYVNDQSNMLPDPHDFRTDSDDTESVKRNLNYIPGKDGAHYTKFCAFSLQPQNYPNAINIDHFPSPILRPGQIYHHDLTYKFGIQLGNNM